MAGFNAGGAAAGAAAGTAVMPGIGTAIGAVAGGFLGGGIGGGGGSASPGDTDQSQNTVFQSSISSNGGKGLDINALLNPTHNATQKIALYIVAGGVVAVLAFALLRKVR